MKKDPDISKIVLGATVLSDLENDNELRRIEDEERIIRHEEQQAKGIRSNHDRMARQNAIQERKQVVAKRKKQASIRQTITLIILIFQLLVTIGLIIYVKSI